MRVDICAARMPGLVDEAAAGEPFIIAKADNPLVQVMAIPAISPRRQGFLAGQIQVPDDFDRMGEAGIEQLFCSDL